MGEVFDELFTDNPFGDTPLRALTRFLVELAAWVLGPWAAGTRWGWLAAVTAAVVLIGVPAVFTVAGDKRNVIVTVPGPVRLLIEIALYATAAIAAGVVLRGGAAATIAIAVSVAAIVQAPRWVRIARA